MEYAVHGLRETFSVAEKLLPQLKPGTVIALYGGLGAGKTAFVQGLARAMGILRPVTSPTFTLIQEYRAPDGRLLVHLDLYRLAGVGAVEEIGFEEYLRQGAIVAVEWPERAAELLQDAAVKVSLEPVEGAENDRLIAIVLA